MRTDRLGAVFDWDGVIIDSHDQHEKAWFRLADELGKEFSHELFVKSFGMRNETIIPEVLHWARREETEKMAELGRRKEELYRQVLEAGGIEPLAGVRELLDALRNAGVPCAVGTSTPRENVATVMRITGLEDCFDGISAAEDVTEGKPAPDVFLVAARSIRRPPAACVVFEDAPVGIEAGLRAGMKTVGVATTHPPETLANAHHVVTSLEDVCLEHLVALW